MRFLCALLAFALAACGRADARETNRPTLSVEYFQQDSARVIARWSRPCDGKGCADGYRVQWTAGAVSRLRNVAGLVDTLRLARPAIGDSIVATVAVTSLRRGLSGPTRSAVAVVRNPDAPPPPVDSLRTDTLSVYEAALLDSFPTFVVRDSLGRTGYNGYRVGDTILLCAMSRNRYTGEVRSLVAGDAPVGAEELTDEICAHARAVYAAERSG